MRPREAFRNPNAPPPGPPQAIIWEWADELEQENRRRWSQTMAVGLALAVMLMYYFKK